MGSGDTQTLTTVIKFIFSFLQLGDNVVAKTLLSHTPSLYNWEG